ncbi:MAG TPA: MFS transporter [Polyangiaceae bacterium]|nr:MFS transporter [Polyangiaceae bacterium]
MAGLGGNSERLLTWPFVLVLCVQFCFGLSYSTFFLLPKFLARQFHANADAIGAVAATALLASVLASPWTGAWLDRGSRRPFIGYGALVNGLSGCGFALIHSISWPIFALRVVHGVSYAFNGVVTLAADLAPPKKLGQAIGLCGAASIVSNAVAPAITEPLADNHGWGLVFLLAGGAALVTALLSLVIREPKQATPLVSEAELVAAPSAFALMREPQRMGAFVCSAANGAAFGAMFTFTQPFALSLGATKVRAFFLGYTLVALSVRLLLGGVADAWGRRRAALTALILYGFVASLTSLLRPDLLFAAGAGLGLAHGLLYPSINALAAEGVPRARRGAVMSYFFGCFGAGSAVWVLGLGVVAKSHGYPVVFLATGVLVWSAIAFLPKKTLGLSP